MHLLSPTRPTVPLTSRLGVVAWRLAAGLLYAGSLLLVPLDLLAAVFALFAAFVCLPGARTALLERTGIRLGGVAAALMVMTLLLGAVLMTGRPVDPRPEGCVTTLNTECYSGRSGVDGPENTHRPTMPGAEALDKAA